MVIKNLCILVLWMMKVASTLEGLRCAYFCHTSIQNKGIRVKTYPFTSSNTFYRVNAISTQVWKFQRYSLVLEYEQKPILPPPLILLSHVYLIIKYVIRRCKGKLDYYDNGLSKYNTPPLGLKKICSFPITLPTLVFCLPLP